MKQYAAIDETVYFWFAGNDTSGSGGDGASPAADVRLAGAAADAAPVYSPTPVLLSNAGYPAGAYEVAIVASAANGFAADNTYAVFCTLAVDSQNPTGFVGSFDTMPVQANAIEISGDSGAADNMELDYDGTGYAKANSTIGTCTVNTDANPDVLYSGTVSAVTSQTVLELSDVTSLSNDTYNGAQVIIDAEQFGNIGSRMCIDYETVDGAITLDSAMDFTVNVGDIVTIIAMRGTDSAALAATALTDVTWTDAKAAFIDHSIDTVDTVVDGIQTDLDNATDGLGALKALIDTIDGIVDAILLDTGTDGVLLAAAATSAQFVDDVWDEPLTGATHNVATSAGRRVRELGAYFITGGTAQAGAAHSITMAATESATDHIFNRNLIVILAGTGAGQTRTIVDYNGTTKVAVVDRDWWVNPDATSEYSVIPDDTPLVADHGVATAGANSTITIRSDASATNEIYAGSIIQIMAGTGQGQSRLIDSYNGTTKVVTICSTWTTNPDATSVYVILPYGTSQVCEISAGPLADIVAAIIAGIADGDNDLQEMMRIILAAVAGKSSGGGTASIKFRDSGDGKDRITATVDVDGNRTAMTLDGS